MSTISVKCERADRNIYTEFKCCHLIYRIELSEGRKERAEDEMTDKRQKKYSPKCVMTIC